jgi:hypothetical protein
MAELTPIREIVIGMTDRKLVPFRCLRCQETHAARGWSPGRPSCGAPEAWQRKEAD